MSVEWGIIHSPKIAVFLCCLLLNSNSLDQDQDGQSVGRMRGSRNYRKGGGGGGGGVQVNLAKKSSDVFRFLFCCLVLSLFYMYRSRIVNFKENYRFSRYRFPRGGGVQLFPGGGGGSNCLFPIETNMTCDFPGGGGGSGSPVPPLDLHLGRSSPGPKPCKPLKVFLKKNVNYKKNPTKNRRQQKHEKYPA